MKLLIKLCVIFACTVSYGQQSLNLAIPSAPVSFMSDRFRAGELDCSMGIGSSTNVEFGVVGLIDRNPTVISTTNPATNNVGVYGRIIIPIGAPKSRVDCTILYDLELKKKRIEVERLEAELRNLRNLRFENPSK